jgi:hypothetical protein
VRHFRAADRDVLRQRAANSRTASGSIGWMWQRGNSGRPGALTGRHFDLRKLDGLGQQPM